MRLALGSLLMLMAFVNCALSQDETVDELKASFKGMLGIGDDPEFFDATDVVYGVFDSMSSKETYRHFLQFIKEDVSVKELLKSSKKKSILEESLIAGRNLYEFYYRNESLVQDYEEFLTEYLSYLISLGLELDQKISSPRYKSMPFSDYFYVTAAFLLEREDPEYLSNGDSNPAYYERSLLHARIAVINALIKNGFDVTTNSFGSSKYLNFYEARLMESLESDGVEENAAFLDFLLKLYPETKLFSGRSIYNQAMKQVETATLNPKFYQILIENGFDANLPCEVCIGLTPLVMLGDLPNNDPLYYHLTSKDYANGKTVLYLTRQVDFKELDMFMDAPMGASEPPLLVQIAEILLKNGANINENNNEFGMTPLHTAVGNGQAELVEFLLEKGADNTIKNKLGLTPLEMAEEMLSLHKEGDNDIGMALVMIISSLKE